MLRPLPSIGRNQSFASWETNEYYCTSISLLLFVVRRAACGRQRGGRRGAYGRAPGVWGRLYVGVGCVGACVGEERAHTSERTRV